MHESSWWEPQKTQYLTINQPQLLEVSDFCEDELVDFANSNSQITDQGLNYLGESLKTLDTLLSINLNFCE